MNKDLNTKILLALNTYTQKNRFMRHFVVFCAHYLIVFISVAVALLFFTAHRELFVWFAGQIILAIGIGLGVSVLLGIWFHTLRPSTRTDVTPLITALGTWKTFPSDHTMIVLIYAGCVALAGFPFVSLTLVVLGFVVGMARVASGVHYPADVLGGALLGWFISTSIGMIAQWIRY